MVQSIHKKRWYFTIIYKETDLIRSYYNWNANQYNLKMIGSLYFYFLNLGYYVIYFLSYSIEEE